MRAPARAGSSRLGDTVAPPPGSASSSALLSLLTARTRAQSRSLRDRPPAGGELVANTAPRPTPAFATLSASRTLTPASAQEVLRAARFGHSVADPKGARPPSRTGAQAARAKWFGPYLIGYRRSASGSGGNHYLIVRLRRTASLQSPSVTAFGKFGAAA